MDPLPSHFQPTCHSASDLLVTLTFSILSHKGYKLVLDDSVTPHDDFQAYWTRFLKLSSKECVYSFQMKYPNTSQTNPQIVNIRIMKMMQQLLFASWPQSELEQATPKQKTLNIGDFILTKSFPIKWDLDSIFSTEEEKSIVSLDQWKSKYIKNITKFVSELIPSVFIPPATSSTSSSTSSSSSSTRDSISNPAPPPNIQPVIDPLREPPIRDPLRIIHPPLSGTNPLHPDILPSFPPLNQPRFPPVNPGNLIGPNNFPSRRPQRPSHVPPGARWDPIVPFPPPQGGNQPNQPKRPGNQPFPGEPNNDLMPFFNGGFNDSDFI